jgi:WD40 repeat protein
VKLPDGFNPIAVVGEIPQDCIAVIAREYQDLQSLPELDSNQLPSPVRERYLACWDLSHSKVLWRTPATQDEFRLPKTSQNGSYLSFILERKVMLLDCKTGNQHELGDFSGMQIESTCFSADGKQLLVAIADNLIRCFETQTGKQRWMLRTPGSPISDLAWSKDLDTIVCVSQDGYLRMFDANLLQMTIELPLPTKHPTTVKLSPEEDWIYVLGKDGSLIRIPCNRSPDARVSPSDLLPHG